MERKLKILLVDDDQSSHLTVSAFLKRNFDPEVLAAFSVQEALIHLNTESVDCIVSDFDMPGGNGYKLARSVLDSDHHIPFIFYTGSNVHPLMLEYKGSSFPIIQKPLYRQLAVAVKIQLAQNKLLH